MAKFSSKFDMDDIPLEKESKKEKKSKYCSKCGYENLVTSKFCAECGTPKTVVKKLVCDKCGWVAPEGSKPTKFCPECGDPVTEQDFQ